MGGKSSRPSTSIATKTNGDGQNTLRAISRGRVYVIISFPPAVQGLENCHFNEAGYDELLGNLQEVIWGNNYVGIYISMYNTSMHTPKLTCVLVQPMRFKGSRYIYTRDRSKTIALYTHTISFSLPQGGRCCLCVCV